MGTAERQINEARTQIEQAGEQASSIQKQKAIMAQTAKKSKFNKRVAEEQLDKLGKQLDEVNIQKTKYQKKLDAANTDLKAAKDEKALWDATRESMNQLLMQGHSEL